MRLRFLILVCVLYGAVVWIPQVLYVLYCILTYDGTDFYFYNCSSAP